ncbi:MAG TPA: response regulator transcription factor [Actinomycetota bacterium]|nr:response regulator transcription factor [Actinomycetota bacterium]
MPADRVLVVDDDPQILRALRTGLRTHGYEVFTAGNGETALAVLAANAVDAVVLDLGLPGIDGHEVIRRLRAWSDVPVVVLSVRDAQQEKVAALDAGADDYLVKPFAMPELLARLRAVRRRVRPTADGPALRFGPLEVDLARRLVRIDGEPVHLTATELRLLEVMVANPGKLLTHAWLLRKVWGPAYEGDPHLLRVYVQQLRRKLGDDPAHPTYILTETGLGYRWMREPERAS